MSAGEAPSAVEERKSGLLLLLLLLSDWVVVAREAEAYGFSGVEEEEGFW